MSSAASFLRIEQAGPVAWVTLNRPEVHNAFDDRLIAALNDAFTRLGADPLVRVVIIAGAGKSFSAGADLDWMGRMAAYSHEENLADARTAEQMFAALYGCPKVTVARVHGAAFGGGAGLVAACDIAIASESALFSFSEVRLGLVPAIISPYVVEKVGMGCARALFVTGRRFGGVEAARLGLVQEAVPAEGLTSAVDRVIQEVLLAGPEAVARTKRLLRETAAQSPAEAAEATVASIAAARVSAEGQEGIRAFREKRQPHWAAGGQS